MCDSCSLFIFNEIAILAVKLNKSNIFFSVEWFNPISTKTQYVRCSNGLRFHL